MLYKYRGIKYFRYLADILLKKRLYAAPYFDLNDPMEGQYLMSSNGGIDQDMEEMLKSAKEKIRICSLSNNPDNPLMWAHYAEGNKGLVIGLDVVDNDCEVHPVIYDGPLKINRNNFAANSVIEILRRKLIAWEYEEEERVFIRGKHFVEIELHEIILGSRMSNQDKGFIKDFCKKVCPEVLVL